jgi:hypothetical protein
MKQDRSTEDRRFARIEHYYTRIALRPDLDLFLCSPDRYAQQLEIVLNYSVEKNKTKTTERRVVLALDRTQTKQLVNALQRFLDAEKY